MRVDRYAETKLPVFGQVYFQIRRRYVLEHVQNGENAAKQITKAQCCEVCIKTGEFVFKREVWSRSLPKRILPA
ncbi:hypothetical protein BpHYR1_050657 [Brachionus plicatilis]|uniref:Uncharacterized protein n=1 Tax=Brachionus plicatilis TaxID=10195 RepID=A0A3M7QM05_BRAPC|nr:hypothetical protein BpHYR1_050657 [Brachionus plicatilis]